MDKNLDPKMLEQLQAMREAMELHELYKKHEATPSKIKDEDGNLVEDGSDVQYVDYNVRLCHSCHMPIDKDNEMTPWTLNTFLGSEKKVAHPLTTILSMETRLRDFESDEPSRSETNHLFIDTETVKYKDYFDHASIRKQLLTGVRDFSAPGVPDADGSFAIQPMEIRDVYKQLVRYEENILGRYTDETKALLEEFMAKGPTHNNWNVRNKMSEVSEIYAALAIRHRWRLSRKEVSLLMRKCKNTRIKQALTVQLGRFRLSAMRGTELHDCLPSYYYCRKHKPQLLQNPDWTAKKFRFDKRENRVVALRYFIDTGLGIENLVDDDHLMCAIARFMPEKYPNAVAAIKKWIAGQLRRGVPGGYQFVFGTVEDRRNLYDVDGEFHLIHACENIEQFFYHILPAELRHQTDNPVNDLLAPAAPGDRY
jgi:hypothetical protein